MNKLDLYYAFAEVSRYRSLSAAAHGMNISQPALSEKISELEMLLNVKLFYRSNRGITLTENGKMLLSYLEAGFSQIEAGRKAMEEVAGISGGMLRIGASDMTLRFFLLDILEKFHRNNPLVKLSVTNAPTPQTLAALRDGLIDIGVISGPVRQEDVQSLSVTPVREIRDIFVCSDSFDRYLSGEIPPELLLEAPLVMLERETSTRRYVDAYFERHLKRVPDPTVELATSDLLLEFARRGIGVASIVEDFAIPDLEAGRLHRIELTKPIEPRNFLLVKSPRATGKKLTEFLKLIDKSR